MLHYEDFQAAVIYETGAEGEAWIHLLPAVQLPFRNRFMYTIRKGFSIPKSFDMIMLSQKLGDDEYDLFVQQAIASEALKNRSEQRIDKFSIGD